MLDTVGSWQFYGKFRYYIMPSWPWMHYNFTRSHEVFQRNEVGFTIDVHTSPMGRTVYLPTFGELFFMIFI